MSTEPSRKREGDQSSEDPPSKIPSIPVVEGSSALHDVVLIVKGQKFYCLKEKLAEHSTFFERMFFSGFVEKNKKEVEIGEVDPDVFQLFIDATSGINSMTDEYSEVALVAAIFLESSVFEEKILEHLVGNSEITLQEQFKMAEDHKSNRLMIQVFASIKNKHELDEVLPKNLDPLCNSTKNLVMKKSLELLGIRKPPSPPLPEDPDEVFELRMNQLIDQIEVQNHHGEVLQDQAELLTEHLMIKYCMGVSKLITRRIMLDDPVIKELNNQLQDVHEQSERNLIEAQIQVLQWKDIHARLQDHGAILSEAERDQLIGKLPGKLRTLAAILNRDERSRSRSHRVTLGHREIDEIYRRITAEAVENNGAEPPRNVNDSAVWLRRINALNRKLATFPRDKQFLTSRPRPNNLRVVSNQASFRVIDEFVRSARKVNYTTLAANILRRIEAQNPRE